MWGTKLPPKRAQDGVPKLSSLKPIRAWAARDVKSTKALRDAPGFLPSPLSPPFAHRPSTEDETLALCLYLEFHRKYFSDASLKQMQLIDIRKQSMSRVLRFLVTWHQSSQTSGPHVIFVFQGLEWDYVACDFPSDNRLSQKCRCLLLIFCNWGTYMI